MKKYLAGIAVSRAIQFGALVVLARSLPVAEAGAVLWLLSVAVSLSLFLEPGARSAYIRESGHAHRTPTEIIRASTKLQSIAAGLATLLTVAAGFRVGQTISMVVAVALGIGFGLDMMGQLFRAHLHARLLWGSEAVLEVSGALLRYGALAVVAGATASPTAGAIALGIGAVAHTLVCVAWSRSKGFRPGADQVGTRVWFMRIWRLGAATTSSTVNSYVGQIATGLMLGPIGVAQYSVATRLVQPMEIVAASLANYLLPALSRRRSRDQLDPQAKAEALRMLALPTVAVVALLVAFGPRLCVWIFGDQYAEAAPLVRLVAPYLLAKSMSYWAATCLVVDKQDSYRLRASIAVLCFMVVANPLLIWTSGLRGAAYATLAGESLLAVLYVFGLRHSEGTRQLLVGALTPIGRMVASGAIVIALAAADVPMIFGMALSGLVLAAGLRASGFFSAASALAAGAARSRRG